MAVSLPRVILPGPSAALCSEFTSRVRASTGDDRRTLLEDGFLVTP